MDWNCYVHATFYSLYIPPHLIYTPNNLASLLGLLTDIQSWDISETTHR